MNFKKISFLLIISPLLVTSCSCSNDEEAPVVTSTFNYTIPETYTFVRNGATSIDYKGQSQRILMLDEMGNYVKTQATAGSVVDNTKLLKMYDNSESQFSTDELNTSGKQIKNKTAASLDYFTLLNGGGTLTEQNEVRTFFETKLKEINTASQGTVASAGIAGKYETGSSTRFFTADGLEPVQVFLKGITGASLLDQVVNHYLSLGKLDENTNKVDNTNKVLDGTNNYTKMEHAWDEAFGYVFGATGDKFLSEYITKVNADVDFNTLKNDISLAFRKGRAAIVANDYATRDEQIKVIKEKLALMVSVRSVYYLQTGKAKLITDNGAAAFHDLSEGYGFIMSLRYTNKPGTNNPYFTKNEVDVMLKSLTSGTNGLWDIDNLGKKLDDVSTQIANKFGFTVAQASIVN
jgi:hypothetical protein